MHGPDRRARQKFAGPGKPFRNAQEIQQRGAACRLEILRDGVG